MRHTSNTRLVEINLEGGDFAEGGIVTFAKVIASNNSVIALNLSGVESGIPDYVCEQLGQMIKHNHTMKRLGLGNNKITASGAKPLADALSSNSIMKELVSLKSRDSAWCSFRVCMYGAVRSYMCASCS